MCSLYNTAQIFMCYFKACTVNYSEFNRVFKLVNAATLKHWGT